MNRSPADPERLLDLPPGQDLVGVSALVRAAAMPLKEIAPASRQRIRGRLYGSLVGRGHGLHYRWRSALILAFTLAVGGVVGAATHSVISKRLSPKVGLEPRQERETSSNRRISMRSSRAAPMAAEMPAAEASQLEPLLAPRPVPAPPSAILSVETSPAQAPRRRTAVVTRSAETRPIPASSFAPRASAPFVDSLSPLAAQQDGIHLPAEATVLVEAIHKLRVDGDASAALRLLDERRARFNDSALSPEASAVRIEALLKLGRADAALFDLDRLPLHAMPRRDEWHVVRGELRAQAGRWSSAEGDFTAVLSGRLRDADGDLPERALWGRSVARSHQGNVDGALADSLEYLRRFPSGRFAGQANQTSFRAPPR